MAAAAVRQAQQGGLLRCGRVLLRTLGGGEHAWGARGQHSEAGDGGEGVASTSGRKGLGPAPGANVMLFGDEKKPGR